jgi:pyruvate-formate lyase-activating enzyme
MYKYKDIKVVWLEITQKCNARCPECDRTRLDKWFENDELSLLDCQKIFPPSFIEQLKIMALVGNYGDAIMAHDTIEVLNYFRSSNGKIKLELHTNGSARNRDWWQSVSKIIKPNGNIRFAIDGIGDVNKIYRIGTNWDKIISNVQTAIDVGCEVVWQFVEFEHNKHQIDDIKILAKKLGVSGVSIRKSRWTNGGKMMSNPPLPSKWMPRPQPDVKIFPRCVSDKLLFVCADGIIVPCCLLGQIDFWAHKKISPDHPDNINWNKFLQLIGGRNFINAKLYTIEEIINSIFFQTILPKSWSYKTADEGRLWRCVSSCGKENEKNIC